MMEESPAFGKITVASEVLETIVRMTTLAVEGVVRMTPAAGLQRTLGIEDGVQIVVENGTVRIDLHIVAESGYNMMSLGRQIQIEVSKVVEEIVGLEVEAVNVYVEDVALARRD
ncbi:MAG: Asp23/Gls24 family envelope stress response protein [Anaerolineae bacterium]|nr:Asp23/Gls24 family envelope stress response protein [Anaerolineae bacterium]